MTRTSRGLRRFGIAALSVATVAAASPLLASSAANAAPTTTKLVANDCTHASSTTTTTTNNDAANGFANPGSDQTGSGCTTQAQVNTPKTISFTYTEDGVPTGNRSIDFTITENTGATPGTARFTITQPNGTQSSTNGVTASCDTTPGNGTCSVTVSDSEAENITVNAKERSSNAVATENIDFRAGSVNAARVDEQSRQVVAPEDSGTAVPPTAKQATPGRPVELRYKVYDGNGGTCTTATSGTGSPGQCTGSPVANQALTVHVDNSAFFTPNCTLTDVNGTPQRTGGGGATAPTFTGNPPVQNQAGRPSGGTLNQPDYRGCTFTPSPSDDATVGGLVSLGQTQTVYTDKDGSFTVTVAEARDTGFDANGIVDVALTVAQGSQTPLSPRSIGDSPAGGGCNTFAPGNGTNAGNGTNGCAADPIEFSTQGAAALNGASISIVPVDGNTLAATPTVNNVPNDQVRVFVVQMRDQYGNLTTSESGNANDQASLTKSGRGTLYDCSGTSSTTNPCPNQSQGASFVQQSDGSFNQTYNGIEGSYTDRNEQQRYAASANEPNSAPTVEQEGSQTLTAKWIAPVTEFTFTKNGLATTKQFNNRSGTCGVTAANAPDCVKQPNDAQGGFDQSETDNVRTSVVGINYYKQVVTNVAMSASPGTSVTPGTLVTITATATDVYQNPVPNRNVNFFRSGTSNNCTNSQNTNNQGNGQGFVTDAQGRAIFQFSCSEASTQNIQASVLGPNGPGGAPSNTVEKTGTITVTFTGTIPSGSPSPGSSSSATPTASTSPSSSPSGTRRALTLTVDDQTTIPAGTTGKLTATGEPNAPYSLQCYTRPSTTYKEARSGAFDAAGQTPQFKLSLGRNTRCFIQYVTNPTQGFSPSVVINVRTVISLSAVRDNSGARRYYFQGRNLPLAAGQLITLYRVDGNGNEIRTSNVKTDASGIYYVPGTVNGKHQFRQFLKGGTFQFKVRTGTTNDNVAGESNVITVNIH